MKLLKKSGFTLIEVMIAITLFSAIMILGAGAVLNSSSIHKKSQTMRQVIDNMSFVMEDMARNIRLGSDYGCLGFPVVLSDCKAVSFMAVDGTTLVVYGISVPDSDGNSYITKLKNINGNIVSVRITPDEVKIDPIVSGFAITGIGQNDLEQPKVTIKLSGRVTYRDGATNFNLQTTVSQRLLDI